MQFFCTPPSVYNGYFSHTIELETDLKLFQKDEAWKGRRDMWSYLLWCSSEVLLWCWVFERAASRYIRNAGFMELRLKKQQVLLLRTVKCFSWDRRSSLFWTWRAHAKWFIRPSHLGWDDTSLQVTFLCVGKTLQKYILGFGSCCKRNHAQCAHDWAQNTLDFFALYYIWEMYECEVNRGKPINEPHGYLTVHTGLKNLQITLYLAPLKITKIFLQRT